MNLKEFAIKPVQSLYWSFSGFLIQHHAAACFAKTNNPETASNHYTTSREIVNTHPSTEETPSSITELLPFSGCNFPWITEKLLSWEGWRALLLSPMLPALGTPALHLRCVQPPSALSVHTLIFFTPDFQGRRGGLSSSTPMHGRGALAALTTSENLPEGVLKCRELATASENTIYRQNC